MGSRPSPPGGRRTGRAGVRNLVLVGVGLAYLALVAKADILHLTNGGSIEGKIVEQDGRSYKIRTLVGAITMPADAVDRVEKKPSSFDEYVRLSRQAANTPAAQVELANWCQEHDFRAGWRKHLKRAIELDSDYAPARAALGFVRVGGIWVDGRTLSEQSPAGTGQQNAAEGRPPADQDAEQMVSAIQTQWTLRIRAIKTNKLDSSLRRLAQEGRRKIVEIRDPLAILPLTRLLASGNWACRDALVEVLSHFPHDEATMNLAVLALVDPDEGIRRRALLEVQKRDDPRVVPQFRRALSTDNDALIRRAAIGLGLLGAPAAVPDLIDVLTARRVKQVEVRVHDYFQQYPEVFNTPTQVTLGQTIQIRYSAALGLPAIGTGFWFPKTAFQSRNVVVYRSEVREALVRITGEDFGFDHAAWRRWYKEQQP